MAGADALPAEEVVRSLFEHMEARDWPAASTLLWPDAVIVWTETGERFDGRGYVEMNRAYPEGWAIELVETVADGQRVAAQIRVTQGETVYWCAGFYRIVGGRLASGVEHWLTEGSAPAPPWRGRYTIGSTEPAHDDARTT